MNTADWFIVTIALWAVAAALIIMALGSNRGDHHHDSHKGESK
jgi:hypothetical protein